MSAGSYLNVEECLCGIAYEANADTCRCSSANIRSMEDEVKIQIDRNVVGMRADALEK